jgi:pimeloyl-ACP methyl ester carboxylesterase
MNEPARLALADPSSADPAASGPVRFVVANGLRFAYLERGRGPLVLLLHGFPDNAETYVDLMEDLAAAGYRAVAPYLRGYAPTEIPEDGAFDPRTLAQDVAGLIGALEPGGRAHLVGMDWGGTSIQAAVVHCPELIASAVIMNAAHPATLGRFATDPDQVRQVFHFWFFQTDVAAQALAAGDLAMVSYLWRLWSPDHDPGPHLDSVRATLEAPGVLPAALAYYGALYEAAQERTFPLGPVRVPTLSVFGASDPTAKHAALEAPFFQGPYRRVELEGVGHWPHLERPAEVSGLVREWFAAHPRGAA